MAASFNELFGLGTHSPDADLLKSPWCQDDAASTTVFGGVGADGTASSNTSLLSTTGPNSWLTKAFELTATDYVNMGSVTSGGAGTTLGGYLKLNSTASTSNRRVFGNWRGGGPNVTITDDAGYMAVGVYDSLSQLVGKRWATTKTSLGTASWHHLAASYDGAGALTCYLDNTDDTLSWFGTATSAFKSVTSRLEIGTALHADGSFPGVYAGWWWFNRELTTAERTDAYNGPEPINSVAPVTSGTASVGQTLSATTGTWGLDTPFSSGSNGTVTYSYQWTRSDDGTGTGEADIAGATSSTYTIQAADSGKYLRCRVRASNDGGFDPAADTATAFTGAISGGAAIGAAAYYYRHLTSQVLR